MGCAFSAAAASSSALRPHAGVRVIHTNGYVQDFAADGPAVTVARATASLASSSSSSSSRYVLCSSAHLLQPGRAPFRPDEALQPGTVYFLLPHSVFQAESSAVDLACLMNRLTALARKSGGHGGSPCPVDALFAADRAPEEDARVTAKPAGSKFCSAGASPAPWKPRLDRIDESVRSASTCSARSQD